MMRYSVTLFIVLSGVARPAEAQQKSITPDLKAMADGKGAKIPDNVSLKWAEDARGKPALKIQATTKDFSEKEDWVIVLTGIAFTDEVIDFDALGKRDPPQSNFLGVAFRVVDQ